VGARSNQPLGRRYLALTAALLALAASCTPGPSGASSTPTTTAPPPATSTSPGPSAEPLPEPLGPLAGLTWPAGSVPEDVLLHDDGRRLWAVPLEGEPEVLWEHPAAHVYEIAAGPGGRELAYSVELPARHARDPSYVLYLLRRDGTIQTVDVVDDFRSIESPIFLQPPTDLEGPVRLYWIRMSQQVSPETGRLDSQVMVLGDDGPLPVELTLRHEEAPWEIHGYPGSWLFGLTLFRTNNVPTRLEHLLVIDWAHGPDYEAGLTWWGDLERPVNTDIFTGVAWITPLEYVIPVAQDFYPRRYSLRLFRFNCEHLGSHVVYRGTAIDWGYAEAPWPLLPGGPDRVLVLLAGDVRRVRAGKADGAYWYAVDVRTGRFSRTDAWWTPPGELRGWWTFVQPPSHLAPPTTSPDCSDLTWTWP
jgi:hypothetical protein